MSATDLRDTIDLCVHLLRVSRCPSDGRMFTAECIDAGLCGCTRGLVEAQFPRLPARPKEPVT